MPILKRESPGTAALLKEAVVLDLSDVSRQAARIVEAAEAKARKIVADAQAEAARLVEGASAQGHEEGRARGLREGRQQGRQQGHAEAVDAARRQFEPLQQQWQNAAGQWEEHLGDLRRSAHEAVLRTALRLGEKIIHRAVEVDEHAVVEQVRQALGYVLEPLAVTVRVHPEDRPLLEQAMPRLVESFAHLQHLSLAEDPAVGRGGCVISHGSGRIDATLDTQLRRVSERLLPAPVALPGAGEGPGAGTGAEEAAPPAEPASTLRNEEPGA